MPTTSSPCKNCGLQLHITEGVPPHLHTCPRCNYRQDGPGRPTGTTTIDRQIEAWIVESRVCDDLVLMADTLGLAETVAFLKARAAELRHVAYNYVLDVVHAKDWGRR